MMTPEEADKAQQWAGMDEATPPAATAGYYGHRPGHEELWTWFGLSYAGWLTLPRVMMHEMPDDWQMRMAQLLREWDEAWDLAKLPEIEMSVSLKKGGKF